MTAKQSIRARWVLPVTGDPTHADIHPIENGVIHIQDGIVTDISHHAGAVDFDFGNDIIIPSLVNCHTHLEFSDSAEPVGPADSFCDWIRAVVKRRFSAQAPAAVIATGLLESRLSGTGLLGEIATSPASGTVLHDTPAVVFRELIGFHHDRIEDQLAIATDHLAAWPGNETTFGLSPHAPYSVHPELFSKSIQLAQKHQAPVAMHLAETLEELEFLKNQSGPFRALLEEFGVWDAGAMQGPRRPLDYLCEMAEAPQSLIIHGNYLEPDELSFIAARPNMTLVFCPRTHRYFGHAPHPFRQAMELGCRVAVGTDSRASNPDLSVLRELQFLRTEFPELPGHVILELGTVNGSAALGRNGGLFAGQAANLAVVDVGHATTTDDPYALILNQRATVRRTMQAGEWVDVK